MNGTKWHILAAILSAATMVGCTLTPSSATGEAAGGDEQFTILLNAFADTDHINTAEYYKQQTESMAGWKGIYIVNKEGVSELYWGKYQTQQAAESNMRRARAWKTKVGLKPYAVAFIKRLPGKDVGPPEWNLANVLPMPTAKDKDFRGYTVLVAVFYDEGYIGRKDYAVEACRELRGKGEEAYYFHDLVQSIVTIGLFGSESVGTKKNGPMTETFVKDPRITQIYKRHPYLAENGRTVPLKIKGTSKSVEKRTYLVEVPKREKDAAAIDRAGNPERR